VFQELVKRLTLLDEVRFWRSKNGAEVDFVVCRQDRMVAVEVKATALRRPQLSRAARSFLHAYRPSCFGVVNSSLAMETEEQGVPVRFCRPWELDQILAAL
jgi:Holliday junction resolvase-like predicted endonuclease